jgi:peptide deformylase
MAARPIVKYGDRRLVAANQPVTSFDGELRDMLGDLFETGRRAPGLGLAAPQIGVNLAVAVVDLSVGAEPEARMVLANPRIVAAEGGVSLEEGCLSFPGLFTTIVRPRSILVKAQDGAGNEREIEADGLLAQAICHEVDHLQGRLIVDHLRGLKRRLFLKKVAKLRRLGAW